MPVSMSGRPPRGMRRPFTDQGEQPCQTRAVEGIDATHLKASDLGLK